MILEPQMIHALLKRMSHAHYERGNDVEQFVYRAVTSLMSIQPDMLFNDQVRTFVLERSSVGHCFKMYLKTMSCASATKERRSCLRAIRGHLKTRHSWPNVDIYDSIISWAESDPTRLWDINLLNEFLSFIHAITTAGRLHMPKHRWAEYVRYARTYLTTPSFLQFLLTQLAQNKERAMVALFKLSLLFESTREFLTCEEHRIFEDVIKASYVPEFSVDAIQLCLEMCRTDIIW